MALNIESRIVHKIHARRQKEVPLFLDLDLDFQMITRAIPYSGLFWTLAPNTRFEWNELL